MTFNNTTKRLERPWTFTSQFAQGDVALRSDFDAVLNDAVTSVNAAIAYLEAVIAGSVIVPTDQRYLGTKATAPTLRNDGGSLQIGDLFVLEATQQPQVYTSLGWARANDAPQPSAFFATLFNDPDEAAFRSSIGLGTSATYPASAFASAAQGITADNAIPSAGQVKITDFNAIPVTKSGQYWADAAVSNGPGPAEGWAVSYSRREDGSGVALAVSVDSGRAFLRRRVTNAWAAWQEMQTWPLASQAEAEGGSASNRLMTPQRVAQYLVAKFAVIGAAPIFAARAWLRADGVGPSLLASGNIASFTRTATGEFSVTFTTAMPGASYAVVVGLGTAGAGFGAAIVQNVTTAGFDLVVNRVDGTTSRQNPSIISIAVFV